MIIVTGGAGFIGSAFVWKLNQEGITDIVIVDSLKESEKWKNLVGLRYLDFIHKDDFIEFLFMSESFTQVDAIIHMGACSSTTETDGDYLMENNFRYTQNLAEWCLEKNVYFLYASSAATYGDGLLGFEDDHSLLEQFRPINRYGYSKHFFDLHAQHRGWLDKIVGLKFFNVFGPNEYHKQDMRSVICKAYGQILENGTLNLFKSYRVDYSDGGQMRDFVYIKDVVNVMWWLLNHRNVTGIFNIGTGQARTWNDLGNAVFKAMGKAPSITYIDMPDFLKKQYQYFTLAPTQKLRRFGCDVQFRSLEDAIDDYINHYVAKALYL